MTGGCLLPNPPQRAGHMFAPTSGWPAPPERPPGLVASGRSQLLTSTASTNRQIQHVSAHDEFFKLFDHSPTSER